MLGYVFDLDGTVLDTRELVVASYRAAGAVPPADVLDREGDDWLDRQVGAADAPAVRFLKNQHYLYTLQHARDVERLALPPLVVARELAVAGRFVGLLTGAPRGTVARVADRLRPWPFAWAVDGVKTPTKMRMLAEHPTLHGGVYVDDQPALVNLPSGWTFVHYHGQSVDELCRTIVANGALANVGRTRNSR